MVDSDDDCSGTLRYREFGNMLLREEGYLTDPMVDNTEPVLLHSGNFHFPDGCSYGVSARDLKGLMKTAPGVLRKEQRGHLMLESTLHDGSILSLQFMEGANFPLVATHVSARLVRANQKGVTASTVPGTARKEAVGGKKKSEHPTFTTSFSWDVNGDWVASGARLEISVHSGKKMVGMLTFSLEDVQSENVSTSGWFFLLDIVAGSAAAFGSRSLAPSQVTLMMKILQLLGF